MSNIESNELRAVQFKALSNPHRLSLFERLMSCCSPGSVCSTDETTSYCVGELGERLNIGPSTVSHHLKELNRAGLIKMEKQGKTIRCWVEPEVLMELALFLALVKTTDRTPMMSCCTPKSNRNEQAKHDEYRQSVRDTYAKVAQADDSAQGCSTDSSCCGKPDDVTINTVISKRLGYSDEELSNVPAGADMGLGCGNPRAIAALRAGEVVVDLGAGGGFDCFLSAQEIGETGHVIGVDMTPDMVSKARCNAEKGNYSNVEFRLGEIEHLPIADNTADVIISNCVINLSPDKPQVFREAFRVLRPGGRLAISDVVATIELPEEMRNDVALVAGCMGNASLIEDVVSMIEEAGFIDVRVEPKDESKSFMRDWTPDSKVLDYVVSATIEGIKPANSSC